MKNLATFILCASLLLACVPAGAQVQDTHQYLQRMDSDGDGRVSPDEYLQWMLYAFDRMDRNADGVLEAAEQPGGRGKPISRYEQRQVILARFARQDANNDGYLSARELMAPPR
jgi:Ca2+-binding EF-hand superfamily protein